MIWLLVMLVIGIVVGCLSHRYTRIDATRESRGGGLFLVMLTVLPLLGACGDGGDDGEEMETPPDPAASSSGSGDLCNLALLFLADPNTACQRSTSSGSRPAPISPIPGAASAPASPMHGGLSIRSNVETEPNDDTMNANIVEFARNATRVGFSVDGSVNDTGDIHDHFTIIRSRAVNLSIQLCPPGEMICEMNMPIDTGTAFYEVLDSEGNILHSSADDASNIGSFGVQAGVSYLVRVVAGDTMGTEVDYSLTAYEKN